MKDIFILLLMAFNIIVILLLNKYKNSKAGSVIGFCWLALVIGIFFLFFTHNFNTFQNLFIGLFGAAALMIPDTRYLIPHT